MAEIRDEDHCACAITISICPVASPSSKCDCCWKKRLFSDSCNASCLDMDCAPNQALFVSSVGLAIYLSSASVTFPRTAVSHALVSVLIRVIRFINCLS